MNTVKKALMERWTTKAPAVLSVANIQDKYIRENMAKLMENQKSQDVGSALNEDFSMGVGAPLGADQGIPHGGDSKAVFAPISLALVRRVFPQLFANVLVGVQPLSGPVGLAFALRYIYKDAGDPNKLVEAAWKAVPEYSGFSGSTANTSGEPDAGTGVDTQSAEAWKITGDYDEIQTHNDFSTGLRGKIPELGLMFSRQSIVAKTRKLAASFSLESAEDIKRMQGVEMMTEMVNVLQYEMTAEIDRETIARCKSLCKPIVCKAGDSQAVQDGWVGRWSQERYSRIVGLIMKTGNDIATATRRAAANIAVVSPDMASVLQQAAPFFNKVTHDVNGSTATPEIGTINGSIKVYRDNYAVNYAGVDNGEVLLAYKGTGVSDCGVVFCPYVTGVVNQAIDPNDFSPRVGVMSRYAFANNMLGADNYYRLLKFDTKSIWAGVDGESYTF
ncbi:MAG: hypothetical protein J6T10_04130 [Methanobrevibacter sp.]|nr:hypothetical protein [Methanobrevibacter sp.]